MSVAMAVTVTPGFNSSVYNSLVFCHAMLMHNLNPFPHSLPHLRRSTENAIDPIKDFTGES